jgi:hypothetical protein
MVDDRIVSAGVGLRWRFLAHGALTRAALAAAAVFLVTAFLVAVPFARADNPDSTVVFNEVMYHPDVAGGGEPTLEWLELHSQMGVNMDISGWSICNGVFYEFPAGTVLSGGGYLVVAANPAALEAATGFLTPHGPWIGRLDNSGERVELCNRDGRIMDSFRFQDEDGWPVAPDGSGLSLAKIDPDTAAEDPASWAQSAQMGGTPGERNFDIGSDVGDVPEGLVSFWDFDETGSIALDSADSNDGSLGATTARVAGIVGSGAFSFDNTVDAFVNCGAGTVNNFSTSTGITIEALIRPSWGGAVNDSDQIFRKQDGTSRIVFGFQHDDDPSTRDVPISPSLQPVLAFGINVGGVYRELDMPLDGTSGRPTLAQLKDGNAHHVAATYSSATGVKSIWVDGALAMSVSLAPGSLITSGGGSSAYIGNMTGRTQPFTGVIDEVAFWNRALGAAEIADHLEAFEDGRDYFTDPTTGGPAAARLAFNEVFAPAGGEGWLEIVNHGAASVALGGLIIRSAGPIPGEHTFPAAALAAGAYLTRSASDLGFDLNAGNKLFLLTANRAGVIDAAEVKSDLRGRHPEATGEWLFPALPTPDAANSFAFREEVVINEIHYHPRPLAAVPPTVENTTIVPIDAEWRYDASGLGQTGSAWRQAGFNDATWPLGDALLFNETAALPAPANTPLTLGAITYYFRGRFEFTGDPATAELNIRPVIDDGAVFYLNGVEVLRYNMLEGEVLSGTFAASGIGDATFTGPFAISSASLVAGTNVLAVEVHQATAASSDIVFGAELFGSRVIDPGHPFQEGPESWVELHNRSGLSVDLGGWQLEDGIAFTFAAGTVLAPGGFLVVAEDEDFLRSLFPSLAIAGNFTGNLSNRRDRIVLKDPSGNPADEVEYFDGDHWPRAADGGASSLELRDPDADNSRSGAWAASDEARRSEWQTYSYEQVAVPNIGPTQWNEFLFGLHDEGEALIDDLRVVEAPGGTEVDFVGNGNFESGLSGWRTLGNHRHCQVITDPDNPSNDVLHLVATGPTEHMHNHVETTILGGRTTVNGRTYRISFRARWLTGSNQLHTRLYFNRVPRTTLLAVPEGNGTPGAENSTRAGNIGPTYAGFGHAPVVPASGEPVTVSVRASDPDGVASVRLWQRVNEGAWVSSAMTAAAGVWTGTVPGQPGAAIIQLYVEGTDALGARSTFPPTGADSRALYKVEDGLADFTNKHNFRIIMLTSDANFLHEPTNVMSNDRMPCTVVFDERTAYYDVGVRLKGSERGRNQTSRVSFNIGFHGDQLFRGVHRTVALDRSGGWGLGGSPGQDEIVVKHVIYHAGGVPAMFDDMVRILAPRAAHNGTALLQMARFGDTFLDSQYQNGGEGSVFELELIYYPLTIAANGLKLPEPDNVLGADIADYGDDKEVYRWNFILTNNSDKDDYAGLMALGEVFSLSGAALDTRAPEVMDVDEWMRTFAIMALCGINDCYTRGNNHNIRMFINPEDGRAVALPWDWDFSFTRSVNDGLWGDQNLQKIITRPPFLHLYYGHLRDIIQSTFNETYMNPWITHYSTLEGRSYEPFRSRIRDRGSFVLANLPAAVAFSITTNSGNPFTVATPTVTLAGNGWIDVRTIAVIGQEAPLEVSWPQVTSWQAVVPVAPGVNNLSLFAFNRNGDLVGSDSIAVTSTFDPPEPALTAVTPDRGFVGQEVIVDGADFLTGIQVFFGAAASPQVTLVHGGRLRAVVPAMALGAVNIAARNVNSDPSNTVPFTIIERPPLFIRGDLNLDGFIEVSDPVRLLLSLFEELSLTCEDAGDADNDELLELADVMFLLNFLFLNGPAPAFPYPEPGFDVDGAGPLDCAQGLP